jgi:hypothetical protein
MNAMMHKIVFAMAFVAGLFALGAQSAFAAPMTCSSEEKTCTAACQKSPLALVADCIAACRSRSNYCKHTGCWDSGTSRYCGLDRQ